MRGNIIEYVAEHRFTEVEYSQTVPFRSLLVFNFNNMISLRKAMPHPDSELGIQPISGRGNIHPVFMTGTSNDTLPDPSIVMLLERKG